MMASFVPTSSFIIRYSTNHSYQAPICLGNCLSFPKQSSSSLLRKKLIMVRGDEKKQSLWIDSPFTGGFPGGETFFIKWTEGGMKEKVPDLDDSLQPTAQKQVEKPARKPPLADTFEYFKDFITRKTTKVEKSPRKEEPEQKVVEVKQEDVQQVDMYEKWFPKKTRNIAPEIKLVYEKDFYKDRVSVAMTEVTASAADVYFPKEMKNKAPFIEINYGAGGLDGASVKLSMKYVEGLPVIAPPVAQGETVTTMSPGAGGGLKLDFSVQGEGPVNVYSDPRCVENYNEMLAKSKSK